MVLGCYVFVIRDPKVPFEGPNLVFLCIDSGMDDVGSEDYCVVSVSMRLVVCYVWSILESVVMYDCDVLVAVR